MIIDHPSPSESASAEDRPPEAPEAEVVYYTDPLCAWSWALEPHTRRLRLVYGGKLSWRIVMGGMIPDWQGYKDPTHNVHKASHMAPHWYQVGQVSGMPTNPQVWHDDPPSSSDPPCLAVKAAGCQGPDVGEAYLRRLREAVMLRGRNIARAEVLLDVASALADDPGAPALDLDRFQDDLTGPGARDAYQRDLREVKERAVSRFPTLIVRRIGGPGLVLTGYRPFEALLDAMARAAPDVRPASPEIGPVEYVRRWGRALDREVALALGIQPEAAREALERALAAGQLAVDDSIAGGYRG